MCTPTSARPNRSTHSVGQHAASQRRALLSHQHPDPASHAPHPMHSHHAWGPLASHALYMYSLGPEAQPSEPQEALMEGIRARGGAVTSFLPPFAWVVVAGPEAAQWMAEQPGTELVGGV